jgi:hypothetical protein
MAPSSAQRALHLDGEVTWPGVSMMPRDSRPTRRASRRTDRDAALALELHRVHLGPDAVLALDVADRVILLV